MTTFKQTFRLKFRLIVGVLFLLIGTGLLVGYRSFWQSVVEWNETQHVLFLTLAMGMVVIGMCAITAGISSTRRGLMTPRIGSQSMLIPIEGVIYLCIMFVLLGGAFLTKQNTLLLVFAMLTGPFVANGWQTFGMLQAVQILRKTPRRAMVGELFGVEMTVVNRRRLQAVRMLSVRDNIVGKNESLPAEVLFMCVPVGATRAGYYHLCLATRGRYRLGPVYVSSRFPLGLIERTRVFDMSDEVLVYPKIERLAPTWKRRLTNATELASRSQISAGVFHDEFHRLREFRIGDNPRDIHWRTSARRGELILREYQQNRDCNLAVVLDLWQPKNALAADRVNELVERVLSFTLTLLVEFGRDCRESTMSLVAAGAETFEWRGCGSAICFESLFEGLAVFEAGHADQAATLLEKTLRQTDSSFRIVFVTTRLTGASLENAKSNPQIHLVPISKMEDLNGLLLPEQRNSEALIHRLSESTVSNVIRPISGESAIELHNTNSVSANLS